MLGARAALQIVDYKMQAAQPKSLAPKPGEATYIKYTPSHSDGAHNSGAQHRVIRMSEMPKDPLDPPKFRHKKVPRGPGSPPVPVLHSPPRAISVKDMQDWKIPACISNWKNAKGGCKRAARRSACVYASLIVTAQTMLFCALYLLFSPYSICWLLSFVVF